MARPVKNLLGLAVLSYLVREPSHPYEVGRLLRDHGDARSIKFNEGSLYMVFGQLAKAGFIAEQATTREGQRPERTIYAITDAGRQELRDWMRELVAEPQHEYPQFVAALSLIAALPPDEVVELLGRRLERLTATWAETRELIEQTIADGVHPLFLVEEEFRLALLEGERTFVEQFIERISDASWSGPWAAFHGGTEPTDPERKDP